MTIEYNQNISAGFQDELNENLRNIENEVGSLDKQVNHQHTVIEEQRLCIKSLNSLVEQQQKEIEELKQHTKLLYDAFANNNSRSYDLQNQINTLTANLLETVKSLTVFVKAIEMRLQLKR